MKTKEQRIAELLENESFLEWFSGKADAGKSLYWQNWLMGDESNHEILRELSLIRSNFTHIPLRKETINDEWSKLADRLQLNPGPVINLPGNTNWPVAGKRWWLSAGGAVAAAICFFVLFWGGLLSDGDIPEVYSEIVTETGERRQVELPDLSIVVLSANSSLRFSKDWKPGEAVTVFLSGEAFFDIRQNPDGEARLFTVKTSDGKISVLGTRFTVKKRHSDTIVILDEGSVEVSALQAEEDYSRMVGLSPGQSARFQRNDLKIEPFSTDLTTRIVWWGKDENLELNRTPLHLIINRLEETYGVRVKVEDPVLLNRRLSGAIENSGLETILDALGKVLQTNVTRSEREVVIGR